MIYFNPVDQLMMTIVTTKPAPSTRPSTRLRENKICMFGLYKEHIKFAITFEGKFHDQLTLIQ